MKWLIDYDAWFFHRVEGLLKWLDEWLSISQKYAERGRRRKAALAELKKMFGTEWIPKPLLEPR